MKNPNGFEIEVGQMVWALVGDCITDKKPTPVKVVELYPSPDGMARKGTLEFEDGSREDWRLDVWPTKEEAQAAIDAEIVVLRLDKDDARFIWHNLAVGFKRVERELSILRITKERELTTLERSILPPSIAWDSREELQEQIDPWISYLQQFIWLMNQMKVEEITKEQEMIWCYGEERARELMVHDKILCEAGAK